MLYEDINIHQESKGHTFVFLRENLSYQFAFGCVHLHRLLAHQGSFWDERRPLLQTANIQLNKRAMAVMSLTAEAMVADDATFSSRFVGMAKWSRFRTSWTFLPFILASTRCARSRSQACETNDQERITTITIVQVLGTEGARQRPHLTSVLTCMTPSSVRVLVSITGTPSAVRSAKIFWKPQQRKAPKFILLIIKTYLTS